MTGENVDWSESAAAINWNIRPLIDGRYRDSTATKCFNTVNPATEAILCRVSAGDAGDVDEAVRIARARFNDGCWSRLPPIRRSEILVRLADLIVEHKAELALLDTLEMGKPICASLYDAERYAPLLLRSWASFAEKLVGESAPLCGARVYFNIYEPRGVVAAITPWNFPTVNAVYKLGPALAAGNTVILKPSELSPSSTLKLAELALEAGIPPGVLNVLPGLGSTVGAALALHPDIDMLSFTGSTATGRTIMEMAGRSNGKPLLLECGGKSPHIVFNDIDDLDAVADAVVRGVVWNQGQVCSAHTRLIVQEDVKDKLLEKLIARAGTYTPGEPLNEKTKFGPVASPAQRDRVKRYVEQGIAAGAHPVLKGVIREQGGCYVSPTIFDRVDRAMSIAKDEIFGPVLCVLVFKTEAQAIELANATEYGLTATAWTRDLGRGTRLAQAIRVGSIAIRTAGEEGPDSGTVLSREPQRASGFGSEVGLRGLQSYSTLKSVSFSGR